MKRWSALLPLFALVVAIACGGPTPTQERTQTTSQALASANQLTTGVAHSCLLLPSGTVQCWGDNSWGELGTGASGGALSTPQTVNLTGLTATAIAGSSLHTCAILSGGAVWCWGNNDKGQLGRGITGGSYATPAAISNLSGAVAITASGSHSCALLSTGTVQCWGDNTYGQLGNGTTTSSATPVAVSNLSGVTVTAVTAAVQHTCALLSDSTVRCWGYNGYGSLGIGTMTGPNSCTGLLQCYTSPAPVVSTSSGPLTGVASISTGDSVHTCAMLLGGTMVCWGYNGNAQIGDGSTTWRSSAVAVSDSSGSTALSGVTSIGAGGYHSCAVVSGGAVQCWGYNPNGQVGNGTTTNPQLLPATVVGLRGAIAVRGGMLHSCALLSGGGVVCWGQNTSGQLGDGTTINSLVPVQPYSDLAVTTHHNDTRRSGTNSNETVLTPANVTSSFGRIGATEGLDGAVYGQPLYVSSVNVPGQGVHDVVYVATEHGSVYAFDADNLSKLNAYSLVPPPPTETVTLRNDYFAFGPAGIALFEPEISITSTPVIDPATSTMYVVAVTKYGNTNANYATPPTLKFRLHALDIRDLSERPGSPVVIGAAVAIDAAGHQAWCPPSPGVPVDPPVFSCPNGTQVGFDALIEIQRAALLLSQATLSDGVHKIVHFAWASVGEFGRKYPSTGAVSLGGLLEFKGWVMSYDAQTLTQRGAWCNGCGVDTSGGGIWQAGAGLAADAAGDVYFMTGNGTYNGSQAYADSVVKLHLSDSGLAVTGSFTPADQDAMRKCDADLASSGPVLLPDMPGSFPHQLLGGGKTAKLYLLNRDNLGGLDPASPTPSHAIASRSIIETGLPTDMYDPNVCATWNPLPPLDPNQPDFAHEGSYHIHGSPVVTKDGNFAYVWGEQNYLRRYSLSGGQIQIPTPAQGGNSSNPGNPDGRAQSFGTRGAGVQPPGDAGHQTSYAMPGGFLSLSTDPSGANGILWVSMPARAEEVAGQPGVLRAFDAVSLRELWNSNERESDWVGNFSKFVPPTVAHGKVYLPSYHNPRDACVSPPGDCYASPPDQNLNRLVMYGLLPTVSVQGTLPPLPGAVLPTDIGIGATKDRDIWVIGTDQNVYHWDPDHTRWDGPAPGVKAGCPANGGACTPCPSSTSPCSETVGNAIAIDVGPQGAWIVNTQNQIFRWRGTGFASVNVPQRINDSLDVPVVAPLATDIAVGANGDVWMLGTAGNPVTDGGHVIFKYGTSGVFGAATSPGWTQSPGFGMEIAVAPDGTAWKVDFSGNISFWSANTWNGVSGSARDIATSADGKVYIVSNTSTGGGNFQISKFDGTSTFNAVAGVTGFHVAAGPGGVGVTSFDPSVGQKVTITLQ